MKRRSILGAIPAVLMAPILPALAAPTGLTVWGQKHIAEGFGGFRQGEIAVIQSTAMSEQIARRKIAKSFNPALKKQGKEYGNLYYFLTLQKQSQPNSQGVIDLMHIALMNETVQLENEQNHRQAIASFFANLGGEKYLYSVQRRDYKGYFDSRHIHEATPEDIVAMINAPCRFALEYERSSRQKALSEFEGNSEVVKHYFKTGDYPLNS